MSEEHGHLRLEIEAIIIGYAMSRLDRRYLPLRGVPTWRKAFAEAGTALGCPALSIKNLRDEFDPIHGNRRRGWHQRPIRPNRQRVLESLQEVSDDALMALVERILDKDHESIAEAVDSMAAAPRTAQNVAQRLLTGRQAEEFFLAHSQPLVQIEPSALIDRRLSACGYDFAVSGRPELAIEVKGLRQLTGEVLFTDREWSEARTRLDHYWLVVVANLDATPQGKVVFDPAYHLEATCSYQTTVAAVWRSKMSVDR
jgi:hypothetical protein